jgi:hypothetical protein
MNYKFKVVDGIHKNSELVFETDESCIVGSGDECDIIISDHGVEKEHLSLFFSDKNVNLNKKRDPIFIDGIPLTDDVAFISPYQIVTIGDAHFAIGPANLEWPPLKPPVLLDDPLRPMSTDLVPIDYPQNSSRMDRLKVQLILNLKNVMETLLQNDKTVLFAICIFFIFSSLFWVDFINSFRSDSIFFHISSKLKNISNKSLVVTGVREPSLEMYATTSDKIDPKQKVKDYLNKEWGSALAEYRINLREVYFRGNNLDNVINLALSLRTDNDGNYYLEGYTLTRNQRKALISEIGDIVRTNIRAAENIKTLLEKTMRNKNIKNPSVQFDIENKIITLEGKTDNLNAISQTEIFITQMFPNIDIYNQILFLPGDVDIIGASASASGTGYICLSDGSKVFKGGKLKNGCIIESISSNMVRLNCNGTRVDYNLGKKL